MDSFPVSVCQLRLSRRWKTHQAPDLHVFFGQAFQDEVRAHTCGEDGRPLHPYPRIQFKVWDTTAVLLGVAEGAELLPRLCGNLDVARLGADQVDVLDIDLETRDEEITACAEPMAYRFVTPWLALNQGNFRSYVGSHSTNFRKSELSRILVGNCLGLAQSLGIRFDERIDANGRQLTSIKTAVNGQGAIGFVGKFEVNLKLPEYLGLGKSAARGFGAVTR